MKICVAQTRPIKGDIAANIFSHRILTDLAISNGANTIVFPELSITGYEPELAKDLATGKDDKRFDVFQNISDEGGVTIGIGMPIRIDAEIVIGMIVFQPGRERRVYFKQHLHSDEYPFFVNGTEQVFLHEAEDKTALSICYELSVPEHSFNAFKKGAAIYIASVAKTAEGVEKASVILADIANKYSMTVLMSNCIGPCDNFESAGRSSVWNNKGELLGQLDSIHEGILIFNTNTNQLAKKTIDE